MRRIPQQYPNPYVTRGRDPRAARRQAILLASCLVLAAGFVSAVRQQIVAVEYGYKTEELRRERERLLDEQQRLRLALEETTSPAHLGAAARARGMQLPRAGQLGAPARIEGGEHARPGALVGTAAAAAVAAR